MKSYRTWIEVSERALANNIQSLRALLEEGAKFCAVVKGNAYGHGLKEVASIADRQGVDAFAVDHINDALILRDIYPSAQIIVLGYTMFDRYKEAIQQDIELVLYDKEGINHAQSVGSDLAKPLKIHLKLETGTSRQGVLEADLIDIARLLQRSTHVQVVGCSTHYANIEDTSNPEYAGVQFNRFQEMQQVLRDHDIHPQWIHSACSAAILLYPQTHQTLVRAGISMYGHWSSNVVQTTLRQNNISCDLIPAMTWKTRIAQVKSLAMGTPVSYGLTEVMKRSGRVAVIPVGYWDGYDRALSSVGQVLIHGYRCKVIGRVCMNMMMVDVSEVPNPQKEDEVVLLGVDGRQKITAEELAEHAQTISYEIITRINPSLPRVIVS
jgi:alanine racemase